MPKNCGLWKGTSSLSIKRSSIRPTEAAIPKMKESQPAPAPATGTAATPEDQKAAIDAVVSTALAAKECLWEGRMKLRLKDTEIRAKALDGKSLASLPARPPRSLRQRQLPVRLPWQHRQLPFRHRLLQPLPHPVQLRRGVVVLWIFRLNLLLQSPPLVPPLANLRRVVVWVVCGEILVFGVPLHLAWAVEVAHLRPQASGLGGRWLYC
jgi:hypothetical protein